MNELRRKKINNGFGFTLVELLVVLAIIGILVTIGLTELKGVKASARDARRISDLAQIRLGLALYDDDHGQYPIPVNFGGNGPDYSYESATVAGSIFSPVNNPLFPGYLSSVPVDPVNSQSLGYWYYYDTNEQPSVHHRNYVLCFHKEGGNQQWFYFYSTGVAGDGDHCPTLP